MPFFLVIVIVIVNYPTLTQRLHFISRSLGLVKQIKELPVRVYRPGRKVCECERVRHTRMETDQKNVSAALAA